jgi:hypothetical protein
MMPPKSLHHQNTEQFQIDSNQSIWRDWQNPNYNINSNVLATFEFDCAAVQCTLATY